jgi:hypothetical protein
MVVVIRDYVTDHAAECGAADGTYRTTVSKHGTDDRASASAQCAVTLLWRHIGTAARQGSYSHAYQCRLAKGS